MLLFDQTKTLEIALRPEAAEVLAKIFEGQHNELASKADLERLAITTKADLRELDLRLKYDLTIRFGAMLAGAVVIIGILFRGMGK